MLLKVQLESFSFGLPLMAFKRSIYNDNVKKSLKTIDKSPANILAYHRYIHIGIHVAHCAPI